MKGPVDPSRGRVRIQMRQGARSCLRAPPRAHSGQELLPTSVVHPVPVKLRRLVEGISSGPGDSREHGREHRVSGLRLSFIAPIARRDADLVWQPLCRNDPRTPERPPNCLGINDAVTYLFTIRYRSELKCFHRMTESGVPGDPWRRAQRPLFGGAPSGDRGISLRAAGASPRAASARSSPGMARAP